MSAQLGAGRQAPVITIDGPSGCGKGTIAAMLAERLGWHLLDSGALYRGLGFAAASAGVDLDDGEALGRLAQGLDLTFSGQRLLLEGSDISADIRTETVAAAASRVARHARVRAAMLGWQRDAARPPGLVADGRDMGTVVFATAALKFYLDASLNERANRRYKQLNDKGVDANLADLVDDLRERDGRDQQRALSPLAAAGDAIVIDTTTMSVDAVFAQVMDAVRRSLPSLC
ncbi:(d)CMP kinase [Thiorhodovibrio frisius]|uniref:Cytidylate kinase n=1 Tax=Thiorhodovibrio frisius TaxID=631362 RepID=H8Z7Y4_9GAMM|nr:(d)CMP kinase [Thiorhodovibrio frisius]EIC20996.1 cytidylate kinase [Thiorhodovibrio frisius]WPL22052.1 Cytidylate kinase [Thiorhodovibrio frisius]